MSNIGMIGGKFLPLHMGHVYAITKAACVVDELYVVLSYSKKRDKKLCTNLNIKEIPHTIRLRWLSQITKDMENVKVIAIEDNYETDEEYNWEEGANDIKRAIGKHIDYVFSSEYSYDSIFKCLYPGAKHIIIDGAREKYPISATKIRTEGIFKNWEFVPDVVKPYFVKKVCIAGTESVGKSTLTKYLAKLYNTSYVEEYGRLMCEEFGGCDGIMTPDIFPQIAYGHKMLEYEALKKANKVLFMDSEAIITQYYSELYANNYSELIDLIAKEQDYDLWLFLEPDVAWKDDGLRVHGENETRKHNNEKLKKMLDDRNINYISISGSYIDRLNKSIDLVDELLKNN